jgi:tellurite resistance protein TehA-like permease
MRHSPCNLVYHVLFTVKKLVLTNILHCWVLPIFPAMLVGSLASTIAGTQPAEHALPILVAGLSYQGLGMILATIVCALYFGRLLTSGLPIDMSRPAMFIVVGSPSFSALALIGMAQRCFCRGNIPHRPITYPRYSSTPRSYYRHLPLDSILLVLFYSTYSDNRSDSLGFDIGKSTATFEIVDLYYLLCLL